MVRYRSVLLIVGIIALNAVMSVNLSAGYIVLKQTDITGAQTDLDIETSYLWSFRADTATPVFSPVMAAFVLKENNAVEDACFQLWSADANFQNTLLIAESRITPGVGVIDPRTSTTVASSSSFTELPFVFTSLDSGYSFLGNYNLVLKSDAGTNGSQQWFVKGTQSNLTFEDENGNTLSGLTYFGTAAGDGTTAPSLSGAPSGGVVPESPSVIALGLLGCFGFNSASRHRKRGRDFRKLGRLV
jgi:hypothetical protein